MKVITHYVKKWEMTNDDDGIIPDPQLSGWLTRFVDHRLLEILVVWDILIASGVVLYKSMLRFGVRVRIGDIIVFLFRRRARQPFGLGGILPLGFPRPRFSDGFRSLPAAGGLDQECVGPLELWPSAVLATVTTGFTRERDRYGVGGVLLWEKKNIALRDYCCYNNSMALHDGDFNSL